ncbi:MAG TPA: ABC transporter permease [Thermoanaerobaculia bacterium]|nr:ABC transporter permease [Thermoanaerobaculia bacterium]
MTMTELLSGLRVSWRRLWRHPGSTALAALALAAAIGADTTVFSMVEAVLLRPLPYRDPGSLVMLYEDHSRAGGRPRLLVAPATFAAYQSQCRAFSALAAQWGGEVNLTAAAGVGEPEVLFGADVSSGFFALLGTRAELGRLLAEADFRPGAEPALVLSHALWRRRFAGRPDILGRTLTLDDRAYTVVGVMPAAFAVPLHLRSPSQLSEFWKPLAPPRDPADHRSHVLEVLTRLAPGTTLAAARAEAGAVALRLAADFPKDCAGTGATLVPLGEQITGESRASLLMLWGAVSVLLLIACANLASMLLARALARRDELALCAALGARRWQLVRQPLGEALLLVALGALGGEGLAAGAVRLLRAVLPPEVPRLDGMRIDAGVLAYATAAALVCGIACGLVPGLRATRSDLQAALRRGGGGGDRRRFLSRRLGGAVPGRPGSVLIVTQLALTLVLALTAGLMIESFTRLVRVDPGFRADRVLTFAIGLPARYREPRQRAAFFQQLTTRLAALPGVRSAGGINRLPLDPSYGVGSLIIEGRETTAGGQRAAALPAAPPAPRPLVGVRFVTPDYFRTLRIPVLRGRTFSAQDDARSPAVVLVNQSLARRFWPAGDPVGARINLGEPGDPWQQVVGVVGDVAHDSLAGPPLAEAYLPYAQVPVGGMQLVVQAADDPLALAAAVRREVSALDRSVPVQRLRPLERQVGDSVARPRFWLLLVWGFAALALLLAAMGVFGLMAYTVARRRREIGIRMALGAAAGDAARMIVGQSARLALAGVLLGLALSVAVSRWLAAQLFGVSALEPLPALGSAALLIAVALLAGYIPARRAAEVDPMEALRRE